MLSSSKNSLRLAVAHRPWLMLPLLRLRLKDVGPDQTLAPDTDLLIEGAGGSANSFAHAAFQAAQTEPRKLSGHTHAPAQVIQAVNWGIPTLVLIRYPEDSVVSLASRGVRKDAEQIVMAAEGFIRSYVHFYKHVAPLKDEVEIAQFDEVVSDFGRVIERINARFSTSFKSFEYTEDTLTAIFGNRRKPPTDSTRMQHKEQVRQSILSAHELRPLLDEARALFDALT